VFLLLFLPPPCSSQQSMVGRVRSLPRGFSSASSPRLCQPPSFSFGPFFLLCAPPFHRAFLSPSVFKIPPTNKPEMLALPSSSVVSPSSTLFPVGFCTALRLSTETRLPPLALAPISSAGFLLCPIELADRGDALGCLAFFPLSFSFREIPQSLYSS